MMTNHVMIDLETLGTEPNSVILSLGAVKFNFDTLELGQEFSCTFRVKEQLALGRKIDYDTVKWWMKQSDEARAAAFGDESGPVNKIHLTSFNRFLVESGPVGGVWAFGAAFDNVLLRELYRQMGMNPAWNYRQDFCFRTFNQFFATPETLAMSNDQPHNALSDARFQTQLLLKQIAYLRTQANQAMMLGRLLRSMAGELTEQATAEDLMNVEGAGEDVQRVEGSELSSPEGTEGDGS